MNAPLSKPAPGGKPRGNATPAGAPRPKSARRRSRELALQGLYEWQVGQADSHVVEAHMREQEDHAKCDTAHFSALLHGCIAQVAALDAVLTPHLDRRVQELSPVEHGVLLIGAYELQHCLDVPYKVAINEAVELAKSFGGTDGHKYVNGVLDKAAADLRPAEVAAQRNRRT
ncbi:NusB antitermination factor [Leptothrix cholodnii SP-6]|uniref:Transcription antitermination protein NusB n=1 Tax=Leptothrix cholodnii (strain ATCC 51168 / LMG 8142 / SP-6) TaxID=395495 RepID=B1XYF7_LEPCP|nr:NusB antitermination factor [Leptothrix cholodnii SP-6]